MLPHSLEAPRALKGERQTARKLEETEEQREEELGERQRAGVRRGHEGTNGQGETATVKSQEHRNRKGERHERQMKTD